MTAGIIALVITGLGALLILVGIWVSLADRKRKLEEKGIAAQGTAGELEWYVKLVEALREYPLGLQLIILGIALLLAGGATGGIAALAAS